MTTQLAAGQSTHDAQLGVACGNQLPAGQSGLDTHRGPAGRKDLHDALLLILADAVDDLERVRIATANRLRALRGAKGLEDSPEYDRMTGMLAQLEGLEHDAVLQLRRAMRAHPLGPFVRRTIGLGEKQAARLLAAIGDPYLAGPDRPRRGPAELWAYCGLHVQDARRPRRRRGEQANWSNVAKMRARLCAESCVKAMRSPYRPVYDRERAKWADRDTTDLHKHNHALAVVAKAILRDLWVEAKRIHED